MAVGAKAGGDMNTGRFDTFAAIRDAWSRVNGSKRYYLLLVLGLWAVQLTLRWVLALLMPQAAGSLEMDLRPFGWITAVSPFGVGMWPPGTAQFVVATVSSCVPSSLVGGALAAFALRRAAGLSVDYGLTTRHTRFFTTFFTLQLVIVGMVWLIANVLPFFLFLPAALGALVGGFVPLFIVDREMGPFEAVGASARLAFANLGQVILLLLFSTLVGLATGVTFGIAGIWLAPLLAVTYASAFREAAGIHTAGEALPLTSQRHERLTGSD